MPMTYLYPENAQLQAIERDLLPVLTESDPIFADFPIVDQNEHILRWTIKDNMRGLQQFRGLNGAPSRVKNQGANSYVMEPGVYGEYKAVDEKDMTARAPMPGDFRPIDVTDLVRDNQDELLSREITLIRYCIWTLLTTGTFTILGDDGKKMHTDSYKIKTYTASVAWSTPATAIPLADFRAVQLMGRGTSCAFNSKAKAYMNRKQLNYMLANTNAADIAGRRTSGLVTVLTLDEINRLLLGEDLPQIEVMDDGYYDESGNWQQFIPDGKVVVVGNRPDGSNIGEYRKTRNANNELMAPGSYVKVVDKGESQVPRIIEVHRGHNGGPVIFYPNGVVVMSV